jgi:hypothetical protein
MGSRSPGGTARRHDYSEHLPGESRNTLRESIAVLCETERRTYTFHIVQ